jgi:hypothetical protein
MEFDEICVDITFIICSNYITQNTAHHDVIDILLDVLVLNRPILNLKNILKVYIYIYV